MSAVNGPAALRGGVIDAVTAAQVHDQDRLDRALQRLATVDGDVVRRVLGTVVLSVVEDLHPDGVDGDDVAALVAGCAGGSAWYGGVDGEVLLLVVAGALGIHPDEPSTEGRGDAVPLYGVLLVTYLLEQRGGRPGPVVDEAIAHLHRDETMELP